MIDPVTPDDLRWAAIGEITARLRNWDEGSWPIIDLHHLGSQSFEVETACRALYTFETGEMVTKADATAWALKSLPGEWHELIRWSRAGRKQLTRDPARVPEVLQFLRWAVITGVLPRGAPPDVAFLLAALFGGVRDALADNFVGLYLGGSLALGGFDPATSDVDIVIVTERPVSDAEFAALAMLHTRIPPRGNAFGRIYEVSYVDRAALQRFADGERRHPTVGADWPFTRAGHPENFIIERWIVREHGITVYGPEPETLIDPITPDELRAAVVALFRTWRAEWSENPPELFATRHYQAFAVETVCRAHFTFRTGGISTKTEAAQWALRELPEPWRSLVAWSRGNRTDETADPARLPDIGKFIRWAAAEAGLRE